jgi:hypothetical protein
MKNILTAGFAVLALAAPMASVAQLQPNELSTNIAGTTTIAAPPQGFNPLTASDTELAFNGFPPRPDQFSAPKAYASWAKAMTASKKRLVPNLEQTNIFHGPVKIVKDGAAESNQKNGTATSSNWSGYAQFSGASSYGSSSVYYVVADSVVPVARQAFGAATCNWDYASTWAGIDGWGSNDVLQAGFEYDAYGCGSATSAYYSPWYEWYPYGEVRITNLPAAAGDDFFIEVWHTSATQGYAYLVNENTDQYVDIGFTAPSGTTLIGNVAEWIVERPEVNGSLATFTNYIDEVVWDAYAITFSDAELYPGSSSAYAITGLDNNGNADSYPTLLGTFSFLMQDEGSAR